MLMRSVCLLAMLLAPLAHAGEMLIETTLADDGALLVTYTPPAGVTTLRRTRIDDVSNGFWQNQVRSLDDCAHVDALGIVLRADPPCQRARLRVEPVLLARQATYEGAQPMAGQGVLAFMGYYLIALKGHSLRWRWLPPSGGYVLHQGGLHHDVAEQVLDSDDVDAALQALNTPHAWHQLGAQQYIYMGRAPSEALPGGVMIYDPALDESRRHTIHDMLDVSMRSLAAAYGRWPAGPVGVVVTTSDNPSFHGDVTEGRMMSLRLPLHPERPQPAAEMQRFIAHEVAHWWNMGVFHSDSHQPWLHEGHAEWTALLIMRSQNLMSRGEAVTRLEAALNRCLSVRGGQVAASMNTAYGRGDDPYACGLSLMLLGQVQHNAQAASQTANAGQSQIERLATLHTVDHELNVADFSAWADGSTPGTMRQLLLDPNQAFDTGLVRMVNALGLGQSKPVQNDTVLPKSVAIGLAEKLMQTVMAPDCGGSSGFTRLPDAFKLGGRLTCQTLRLGADVVALNGIALLTDPLRAWQGFADACAQHGEVSARPLSIQYRQGLATDLACPAVVPSMPLKQLIVLDESALAKAGL